MKKSVIRLLSLVLVFLLLIGMFSINFTAFAEVSESDKALKVSVSADSGTLSGKILYLELPVSSYVLSSGDVLEYDVTFDQDIGGVGAVDIVADGAAFRDYRQEDENPNAHYDQNNIHSHPGRDISDYAYNQWYHRTFTIKDGVVGQTVQKILIAQEFAGEVTNINISYANIKITNNGTVKKVFFNADAAIDYTNLVKYAVSDGITYTTGIVNIDLKPPFTDISEVEDNPDGNYLHLEASADSGTLKGKVLYLELPVTSYVLESGDVLEYDVIFDRETAGAGAVDVVTEAGAFRDYRQEDESPNAHYDQNNIHSHPGRDISAYAYNQWYHRTFTIKDGVVGQTVQKILIAQEFAEDISNINIYYANIKITNGGTEKKVFFDGTSGDYTNLVQYAGSGVNYITSVIKESNAKILAEMLSELPSSLTFEDAEEVQAIINFYETMTEDEKAELTNEQVNAVSGLKSDIQYIKAAKSVAEAIDALPSNVTKQDKEAVIAVRNNYTGLLDDVKQYLPASYANKVELKYKELLRVSIIFGDVNEDGSITAADALLTLQSSVSKITLGDFQTIAANVDGNEAVTAADALLILQYSVNKIYEFPVSGTLGTEDTMNLNGSWQFYADKAALSKTTEIEETQENTTPSDTSKTVMVSADGNIWYGGDVSGYNTGGEKDLIVNIPISLIKSGTTNFTVDSTIGNTGLADGNIYLAGAKGVTLELMNAAGTWSPVTGTVAGGDFLLGTDLSKNSVNTADISFNMNNASQYIGARIKMTVKMGVNASGLDTALFVRTNNTWSYTGLSSYKNNGNNYITTSIPVSALLNGENSIVIDSNVNNEGNCCDGSIDLLHCINDNAAGKSYISNNLNDWSGALHSDRDLHIVLRLKNKNTGEWTEIKYDNSLVNGTCVIGLYQPNSLKYYHRQDFTVNDVSLYSEAQVVVQARVGKTIKTEKQSQNIKYFDNSFLSGGNSFVTSDSITGLTLDIPDGADSTVFKKIQVQLSVGSSVSDSAVIYSRINSGEWTATPLSDYIGKSNVWVELPAAAGDFVNGANTVEFKSDINSTDIDKSIRITCGVGGNSTSYVLKDGKKTALTTLLRVKILSYDTSDFEWKTATVPGAWETYGQTGSTPGENAAYDGVGWYKYNYEIPALSAGYSYRLVFDAVDYASEFWLNGCYLGSHEGGYTEIEFDLSAFGGIINYGGMNELVVRVTDQSFSAGSQYSIKETLAGFLQDSIGMNYAGIWGDVYMKTVNAVNIEDVFINPDSSLKSAAAKVTLSNSTSAARSVVLALSTTGRTKKDLHKATKNVTIPANGSIEVDLTVDMAGASLWSADAPNLYDAKISVSEDGTFLSGETEVFGMRTISTNGNKFVLNGENIFLTGVIDWMYNYETFDPAVSPDIIREEIKTLKKAGFNAIKFCLVVPPDYVFDIMDELGMYAYVEYPIWNPTESEEFFNRAYSQLPEMIEKDRNHPSLILSDFNCEMHSYSAEMDSLMNWAVNTAKTIAPNRLYLDNSSNGIQKYGDYSAIHPYNQLNNFSDVIDTWVGIRGSGKPLVLGEFADTDTLRDFDAITDANGGIKPWWWSTLKVTNSNTSLKSQGYTDEEIKKLITASVDNALEAKTYYVEEAKKNNTVGGFFLTHYNDIGSTRPGLFDELGNFKFSYAALAGTMGEASLSLNRQSQNVWGNSAVSVTPSFSYYNGIDITNGTVKWSLVSKDTGKTVKTGTSSAAGAASVKTGGVYTLGKIDFTAPSVTTCTEYSLVVEFVCSGFTVSNSWSFWVYPKTFADGTGIQYYDPSGKLKLAERYSGIQNISDGKVSGTPKMVIATAITDSIKAYLNNGGTLIYLGAGSEFVPTGASTNWNAYSMPFILNPSDEMLGGIGAGGYGCQQFFELAALNVIKFRSVSGAAKPIIGQIDLRGFNTYSYLSEFTIGSGTLVQSTLRFDDEQVRYGDSVINGGSLYQDSYENVIGRYLLDQIIKAKLD